MVAISSTGSAFDSASERLRNDPEVIAAAMTTSDYGGCMGTTSLGSEFKAKLSAVIAMRTASDGIFHGLQGDGRNALEKFVEEQRKIAKSDPDLERSIRLIQDCMPVLLAYPESYMFEFF